MTRIATTYYGADPTTQFQWATAGSDQFSRIYDLYYLAQALEYHDHSNTRGLAVARVADGSLTAAAYGALSVGTAALANTSVTNGKLGDLSVSTAKLQDGAISTAKIAQFAIIEDRISDQVISTRVLATGSVTGVKIATGTITGTQIATGAVDSSKIATQSITAANIASNTITEVQLALGCVIGTKIASATIGQGNMAANSVGTSQIIDGSVTSAKLATGAGVPSGIIAAVPTAAQIPSGWTRYTDGDGRFLIGAGTTFSQTFNENNNWGASNWTPVTGLTTDVPTSTFVAAAAAANNATGSTGVGTSTHLHTINGQSAVWIPPSRVVVWCQKS